MDMVVATRETYIINDDTKDEVIEVSPWINKLGYDISVIHGRTQQTLSVSKTEWEMIENIMKKVGE